MSIHIINTPGRKYGKQKTTLLNGRTSCRKVFSTPTAGQQRLIDKAKRHSFI